MDISKLNEIDKKNYWGWGERLIPKTFCKPHYKFENDVYEHLYEGWLKLDEFQAEAFFKGKNLWDIRPYDEEIDTEKLVNLETERPLFKNLTSSQQGVKPTLSAVNRKQTTDQFKEAVNKIDRTTSRVFDYRLPVRVIAELFGFSAVTLHENGVKVDNLVSVCDFYARRIYGTERVRGVVEREEAKKAEREERKRNKGSKRK